jgi:hypothetical protein
MPTGLLGAAVLPTHMLEPFSHATNLTYGEFTRALGLLVLPGRSGTVLVPGM